MAYKGESNKSEISPVPVGNRSEQDYFDTAQWMGRASDGVAERKCDSDKLFRAEEDK